MRRKVAAVCATALALGVAGSSFAGQGEKSPQQEEQRYKEHEEKKGAEHSGSEKSEAAQGASDEEMVVEETAVVDVESLRSDQIVKIQTELSKQGLYDGEIDGTAGPKTEAALSQFQEQRGLQDEDETLAALGVTPEQEEIGVESEEALEPVSGSDEPSQQRSTMEGQQGATGASGQGAMGERQQAAGTEKGAAPATGAFGLAVGTDTVQLRALNPEQARNLQMKLQELGLYKGEVDGVIGPQTRASLSQFYTKQAQLASRGIILEDATSALGVDSSGLQPVRGTEGQGQQQDWQQQPQQRGTQPQQGPGMQQQGTQQQPHQQGAPQQHEGTQQQPQQNPQQQSPQQQQQQEQQRIPEQSPEY